MIILFPVISFACLFLISAIDCAKEGTWSTCSVASQRESICLPVFLLLYYPGCQRVVLFSWRSCDCERWSRGRDLNHWVGVCCVTEVAPSILPLSFIKRSLLVFISKVPLWLMETFKMVTQIAMSSSSWRLTKSSMARWDGPKMFSLHFFPFFSWRSNFTLTLYIRRIVDGK